MPRHLLLALLLVGLAVAGGVHYDAAHDRHWPYPTDDQLYADYPAHVGEETLLFGTVRSVAANGTATVEFEADDGSFVLQVRGVDAAVEPGGVVQVYGTLRGGHRMTATEVVVVERHPGERLYKFGISGVGALVALTAFFRYWRIDVATLTFEPR